MIITHGVGSASWSEILLTAARGIVVVRAGDYTQVEAVYASSTPTPTAEKILLVASQLIAPLTSSIVQTTQTADGVGKAAHVVPVGAVSLTYIGPTATSVAFVDSTPANIASMPGFSANPIAVPLTAATVEIFVTPGAQTCFLWRVD
jgi:hypothetical protein